MPTSNKVMIKKLQQALNRYDQRVLYLTHQFFSNDENRPITMYKVQKSVWDENAQHNRHIKLFESTSQIQVVLYLRDYWYALNGWDIPTDNTNWNNIKQKKEINFDWVTPIVNKQNPARDE